MDEDADGFDVDSVGQEQQGQDFDTSAMDTDGSFSTRALC
jgi:hypothetical protein